MLLGIAFLAFVSLGLPDGVLGVAWPSIRGTFALPISQLGALLFAAMGGYLASSFSSGAVVARIGVGRLLLASSVVMVVSLLGSALAPGWRVMLACGVLAGLGAGAIDAGINGYAAAHCSARTVNWLHACYGIGAMLGPLLMTGVLSAALAWRCGYGLIGGTLAAMAVCFFLTLDRWEAGAPRDESGLAASAAPTAGIGETLGRPVVWMNIALFFLYTGLEVTTGQWTYSLFTEGRGVNPGVAGIWVAAFWGSLTAGRVAFGALAGRFPALGLLRLAMGSAPVGAALIWSDASRLLSLVGLVVLGLSLAPIYPLLIAGTPARVGASYATPAIGFQVAAAYLGTAALPGTAGLLARWRGLEVIGPFLVAAALALLLLHELAVRRGRVAAAPFRSEEIRNDPRPTRPRC